MLTWMKELLDKFLHLIVSLLPLSPFLPVIQSIEALPYLSYLNWMLPIGDFLKIGSLWLAAIGLYYAYMVIARWVKLLGD